MEKKHYSLGTIENNGLIKIIRIAFGVVCIAVAIFWLIFNIKSLQSDVTLWITIFFLSCFGFYQIWSGLGYAAMYIEIGNDYILLKKNPILPAVKMSIDEIEKIELFPMNIIFILKNKKRKLLRFGTTYHDINEKVTDEIIGFAGINKIHIEMVQEEL